jgi:very-short-patch-repair endonuclease
MGGLLPTMGGGQMTSGAANPCAWAVDPLRPGRRPPAPGPSTSCAWAVDPWAVEPPAPGRSIVSCEARVPVTIMRPRRVRAGRGIQTAQPADVAWYDEAFMTGKRPMEAVIDELAAAQHGVVCRAQLYEAGLSARAIDRRVGGGRLKVLYRGVYRVGPVAGLRAQEMAAVLACGAEAVVSHRSAASAWQILPPRRPQDPLDITVPGVVRRRLGGIRAHRARTLAPGEVVRVDGVPFTSPGRTLLDLANVVGPGEFERAAAQAERLALITPPVVKTLLIAHARHPGSRALRRLFEGDSRPAFTRSEAEAQLLGLIRKARLRAPETNVRLAGYEVDFLWAAEKLVVEVDGYAWHSSAGAFARDRRRDATLTAAGFRVVRVTWTDIVDDPEATLVNLAQALARSPLVEELPGNGVARSRSARPRT